MSHFIIVVIE